MTDHELPALPLVATHWGAYRVETCEGRVVQLHPFELDPHPSPIGHSMVGTLNDACRITRPMVRRGWLRHGRDRATTSAGLSRSCRSHGILP